jgi:hypothetical protein
MTFFLTSLRLIMPIAHDVGPGHRTPLHQCRSAARQHEVAGALNFATVGVLARSCHSRGNEILSDVRYINRLAGHEERHAKPHYY